MIRRNFASLLAKDHQWFHCCAEGFADGKRCHIGSEKRDAFKVCKAQMRRAMKPGERQVLAYISEGRLLNLIETAKAHFRAKVEHPFRLIKCQFGFRKVYNRGINKNDLKLKMLFPLANLWIVRERCPCIA